MLPSYPSLFEHTEKMLCIAHRGGPTQCDAQHPENSLAGIGASLQLGVDMIEIDLWYVADELWITHDRRLGKQLKGQGRLIDLNKEALNALELANGEPLPTLQQALDLIAGQCRVNIEIKGPQCAEPLLALLNTLISDGATWKWQDFVISSFDQRQLHWLQKNQPKLPRALLIEGLPLNNAEQCAPMTVESFNLHLNFIDQEIVDDAHTRGLKIFVYTANHIDDWQHLKTLGVDGVFTDCPAEFLTWRDA